MVKRKLGITALELLGIFYLGIDILIRINEFISKQEPKSTATEYILVNVAFFMITFMIIIAHKVYTKPKEVEKEDLEGGQK